MGDQNVLAHLFKRRVHFGQLSGELSDFSVLGSDVHILNTIPFRLNG
jgi:hypothetical protein